MDTFSEPLNTFYYVQFHISTFIRNFPISWN